MSNVGFATMQVVPSFQNLQSNLAKGFNQPAVAAGRKGGAEAGKGFGASFLAPLKGIAGPLAAVFAGTQVISFFKGTVTAASDAQQSVGATETVFGKFAQTVIDSSGKAANKFGLSANEYRENMNLLGSLFKNGGVAADQLAGKTDNMIGVASDLAATFGGTTSEAVEALGSAFKGEFDPLERFGISIKQSTINTEAMRVAGVKTAADFGKLTDAQQRAAQQTATTNLITKQAGSALGAFGRESNTLAGQQQRLGAQWDDLKVKIGSAFLPVLTNLATFANTTVMPMLTTFVGWVQNLKSNFEGAGSGAGGLASKFAPIVAGGQQVIAAFQGLWATVSPIVAQIAAVIRQNWGPISAWISQTFGQIVSIIGGVMGIIATQISNATALIRAVWNKWGSDILSFAKTIFSGIGKVISAALSIIQGAVKLFSSILKGDWSGAWNAVKQIVSGAINLVKSVVQLGLNALSGIAKGAWALVKTAFSAGVDAAVALAKGLGGKIKGALGNLGSLLKSAGQDLARGFINGIGDMVSAAANKAKELASAAKNAITGLLDIHSPSRVMLAIGRFFGQGFSNGIDAMRRTVTGSAVSLAGAAVAGVSGASGAFPIRSASADGAVRALPGFGSGAGARPIEINVNGADDPVATARETGRILARKAV